MNSELEKACGDEMRLVAREYADGQYNKEQYRNRRRDILLRCLESEDDTQDMPRPDAKALGKQASKAMFWWRMAGLSSIVLIALAGYVLYRIT